MSNRDLLNQYLLNPDLGKEKEENQRKINK
jgi:hypothetical protein